MRGCHAQRNPCPAISISLTACIHSENADTSTLDQALAMAGHRVAQLKCARCHAIEQSGESANPGAPPFRRISNTPALMTSTTNLREGIRIGHVDMPPVRLTPHEIDELSAYLRSLQP